MGIVQDKVIRKGLDSPKPQWKAGYFLAGLTAQWTFGQEGTDIIDGRFHAIRCLEAIPGNLTPNLK